MSTSTQTERIADDAYDRPESNSIMVAIRRLILLAGPLGAAVAMWIHPHAGENAYESLAPTIDTFVVAHALLFVSLALVAVGLYFLSAGYRGPVATLVRGATGVFAFFYLGFVAIVGLTKGLLIREAQPLSAEQQAGVAEVVQYLHTDSLLFAAGAVGATAFLAAIVALIVLLYRAGAPRIPLALLAGSIVAIGVHEGSLAAAGMASFLIAVSWLEFGWSPSEDAETAA